MRFRRMRGYGSWSIGWREGERRGSFQPRNNGNNNGGLGPIILFGFLILTAITLVQVSIQTGSLLGILIGIALVAGILKGVCS